MNRIVAIVAGLHVLAHSVFGCCGHDSHSVTTHATDSAVLHCCDSSGEQHFSEPDEGGGCHDHCVGTVDVEVVVHAKADCPLCAFESSQQIPHQCSHGSCEWLASKPVDASALVTLSHTLEFFAPSNAAATFATTTVCVVANEQRQTLALPLRLHLALGVLLI